MHSRSDGRDLWFSYKDADGRGVYFKVCWNSKLSMYKLYLEKDLMLQGKYRLTSALLYAVSHTFRSISMRLKIA